MIIFVLVGATNVLTTTPLWVVNTRLKIQGVRTSHHKKSDEEQKSVHYKGIAGTFNICFARKHVLQGLFDGESANTIWQKYTRNHTEWVHKPFKYDGTHKIVSQSHHLNTCINFHATSSLRKNMQSQSETSKHSSRMRTTCLPTVPVLVATILPPGYLLLEIPTPPPTTFLLDIKFYKTHMFHRHRTMLGTNLVIACNWLCFSRSQIVSVGLCVRRESLSCGVESVRHSFSRWTRPYSGWCTKPWSGTSRRN